MDKPFGSNLAEIKRNPCRGILKRASVSEDVDGLKGFLISLVYTFKAAVAVVVTLLRENSGGDMHIYKYTHTWLHVRVCGGGSPSLLIHTHTRPHTHTETVWQF